jgi:hypothetical protein
MHGSCSSSGVNGLTGCNVKYGEWEHNVIFSTRRAIYRGAFAKLLLREEAVLQISLCVYAHVCVRVRVRAGV